MQLKNNGIIFSVASVVMASVLSAYVSHRLTAKHISNTYEALIEEEVTKAKAFYSQRNKTDEYSDPVALAERLVGEVDETDDISDVTVEVEEDFIMVEGKPFRETMEDVNDHVDYSNLAQHYNGPPVKRQKHIPKPSTPEAHESMEAFEQRLMDEAKEKVDKIKRRVGITEEDEIREEEEVVMSNIFDTHEAIDDGLDRSNRDISRPYILSYEEFMHDVGEHVDFTQNSITYYEGDNVLVDERDQPIPDLNTIVGERNLKFGGVSGDDEIVYIRNHNLEVDFEVVRSYGTYAEEVLGFAPPEKARKNRGS